MRLRAALMAFTLLLGGCVQLPERVRVEVDDRMIEIERGTSDAPR